MKLRYGAVCRGCSVDLPPGVFAVYDKVGKSVTCVGCIGEAPTAPVPESAAATVVPEPAPAEPPEVVVGVAGASARRE
jgi:hypothetical protein